MSQTSTIQVEQIPIGKIKPHPHNPRYEMLGEELDNLADNLKQTNGPIDLVVVRPLPGGFYEMISGERRLFAASKAGQTHIPARIMKLDDQQAILYLINANLHRKNFDPVEFADLVKIMQEDHGMSLDEIAEKTSTKKSALERWLRATKNLPDELRFDREWRQKASGELVVFLGKYDDETANQLGRFVVDLPRTQQIDFFAAYDKDPEQDLAKLLAKVKKGKVQIDLDPDIYQHLVESGAIEKPEKRKKIASQKLKQHLRKTDEKKQPTPEELRKEEIESQAKDAGFTVKQTFELRKLAHDNPTQTVAELVSQLKSKYQAEEATEATATKKEHIELIFDVCITYTEKQKLHLEVYAVAQGFNSVEEWIKDLTLITTGYKENIQTE